MRKTTVSVGHMEARNKEKNNNKFEILGTNADVTVSHRTCNMVYEHGRVAVI